MAVPKRHHGLADLLGNASDIRFHDGSGSELSAAPFPLHGLRFSGGGESDPFDFLRAVSFFTGVVRRRIEAVNLSHDQENRDYPSQPQGVRALDIIGDTELRGTRHHVSILFCDGRAGQCRCRDLRWVDYLGRAQVLWKRAISQESN